MGQVSISGVHCYFKLVFFNFMKKGHLTLVCEICAEPSLYPPESTQLHATSFLTHLTFGSNKWKITMADQKLKLLGCPNKLLFAKI